MKCFRYIIWLIFLLFYTNIQGQDITSENKIRSLIEVLKQIENQYDIHFSYPTDLIRNIKIDIKIKSKNLPELLNEISSKTDIDFVSLNDKFYYLTRETHQKLNKVVIYGYLVKGMIKNKDGSFEFDPSKTGIISGLSGSDLLGSIQLLPGVTNVNETSTELIVHGGLPDENNVIWDKIHIFQTGHLYGMISAFNSYVPKKVKFYNKGTPPQYGHRISSVLNIQTNNKIPYRNQIDFGINGISSFVQVNSPLIKNTLGLQLSFRRSYQELYKTNVFKNYEQKILQNTDIQKDNFYFYDANFTMNYHLNAHNFFKISGIITKDFLNNQLKDFQQNSIQSNNFINTLNEGISYQWKHKFNEKFIFNQSVSFSNYNLQNNKKEIKQNQEQNLIKINDAKDFFINNEIHFYQDNKHLWKLGFQYSYDYFWHTIKNKTDIEYLLDQDKRYSNTYAIYGQYSFDNSKTSLNLGLRSNYYRELNQYNIEPRINLQQKIYHNLFFNFTAEIKHQNIIQIRDNILNNIQLENKVWRLSDLYSYPVLSSRQLTTGILFKKKGFYIDTDIFYKKTDGISSYFLGLFNLNDNRIHAGIKLAKGGDIFIRKQINNNFTARMSYAYTSVKNKFENLNNNRFFSANTDIRHIFSTGLDYHYQHLAISLGWQYHSGKPYTKFYKDHNGYIYFDEINTGHLPDYQRFDISANYKFQSKKWKYFKAKIGLSIRNIFNNTVPVNIQYEGNNALNDPLRIYTYYSLKRTADISLFISI